MSKTHHAAELGALPARYRVTSGASFDLDSFASGELPPGVGGKHEARALLKKGIGRLSELQEQLYANGQWSLLLVLQGMDAAGKDSTIKHVMSGVNPQGVNVTSFKAPGPHELAHDFLWRVHKAMPARGMIGIFNRSHYEDVLVTRVHPDVLEASRLPKPLRDASDFWQQRIADIAAFEAYLARQGKKIVKIFLNVGRDEQKKRFLKRLEEPDKLWKFDAGDIRERAHWDSYRNAYKAAIAGTATPDAPWFVVPADRKWVARLVVVEILIEVLAGGDLARPEVANKDRAFFDQARRALVEE